MRIGPAPVRAAGEYVRSSGQGDSGADPGTAGGCERLVVSVSRRDLVALDRALLDGDPEEICRWVERHLGPIVKERLAHPG